jgi:predicted RNase H-like HicB family nuclease
MKEICNILKDELIFMRKYLVIYERGTDGYSAYVPDLPGCTSAGADRKEVERNIIEAIKLHLEVMRKEGLEIPESTSESEMLVLS